MNDMLTVFAGLAATYLFLSVVVLAIVEAIAGALSMRAKSLEQALRRALDSAGSPTPGSKPLCERVFDQPLIKTLGAASGRASGFPSYIPTPLFARAFLEHIVSLEGSEDQIRAGYQTALAALPEGERNLVQSIVGRTITTVDDAHRRVEHWFDGIMDRLSGAYRRRAQVITRVITILLVLGLDADTLSMGRTLWADPVSRAAAVTFASDEVKRCTEAGDSSGHLWPARHCEEETLEATARSVPVPIGWDDDKLRAAEHEPWEAAIGLLLTFVAVSLGAPFWFDVLRRVSPGLPHAGPRPGPTPAPTPAPARGP